MASRSKISAKSRLGKVYIYRRGAEGYGDGWSSRARGGGGVQMHGRQAYTCVNIAGRERGKCNFFSRLHQKKKRAASNAIYVVDNIYISNIKNVYSSNIPYPKLLKKNSIIHTCT